MGSRTERNGRHRLPMRARWLPIGLAAAVGVAAGAGAVFAVGAEDSSATAAPAANSTPAQPVEDVAAKAESKALTSPVMFGSTVEGPAGISATALRPEKIKGGVRVTVAMTNTANKPTEIDIADIGPLDPTFNGDSVPVKLASEVRELDPGEGYSYTADIKLPSMKTGKLSFGLGSSKVSGRAAGD